MFGKLLTDLRTKSKLVFARPVYVTEIYYERLQDMLIEIRKRLTEAIAAQNLIEEAISKDLASIGGLSSKSRVALSKFRSLDHSQQREWQERSASVAALVRSK